MKCDVQQAPVRDEPGLGTHCYAADDSFPQHNERKI